MRCTKLRSSIAVSLALLAGGCSLAYNGSRYQGGTGSDGGPGIDTGVPADTDAGVCSGPGSCPAGTYCNVGVCTPGCNVDGDCTSFTCNIPMHRCQCVGTADCESGAFCSGMLCTRCDFDMDGYYSTAATDPADMRTCAMRALPGDCDDHNAAIRPLARADCSTALIECCPLPFAFPTPPGMPVREIGVSPVHALFRESATQQLPLPRIGIVMGNDSPLLSDGSKNGFVAAAVQQGGATNLMLLPLTFDGPVTTPLMWLSGFNVGDFAVGTTLEGTNPFVAIAAAAAGSGAAQVAYSASNRGMPVVAPMLATLPDPLLGPSSRLPSVAIADWVSHAAAATVLTGGSGPYVANFSPSLGHRTGNAMVMPGTWLAGAGAAVMWAASGTSVGVWNGAEASQVPQLVDLSTYTSAAAPPQLVLASGRGAIAAAYDGSSAPPAIVERFVAAVPIGDTTTSPMGQIVLLRWTANRPTSSTDATVAPLPMAIRALRTTGAVRAQAGVALLDMDGSTVMLAYQDGNAIMLRTVGYAVPTTMPPEDPPGLAIMPIAPGEIVQAIAMQKGFFPVDPQDARGMGRVGVAVQVLTAAGVEVRVRAIEGCF